MLPIAIIDPGTMLTRAGFSNERFPTFFTRSLVGRPRNPGVMVSMGMPRVFVGDEAQRKRGILSLKMPIKHGIIESWDDFIILQKEVIDETFITEPERKHFLFSHSPRMKPPAKHKLAEIIFDTFEAASLYLSDINTLSLFASARSSGIVLNSGLHESVCSSIVEGKLVSDSIVYNTFAGNYVDMKLQELSAQRGYSFTTTAEFEILAVIKKTLGFVPISKEINKDLSGEKLFELPDGQIISFESELWNAPNSLFHNSQNDSYTMQGLVRDCFERSDLSLKSTILNNVVVSGGNTKFEGFDERLENELSEIYPGSSINVSGSGSRSCSAWVGGSIISSLSNFIYRTISREQFDEHGPSIYDT